MNLLHLKYAVEVSETNSMTRAAENLYTAQPNLSRAIAELEKALGIKIFKRSPKGITPTPQGEEFLGYARKILAQVDAVESMYKNGKKESSRFSISVPRASYIACAFTDFTGNLPTDLPAEVFYKETNSLRAINNIVSNDYKLGIIRYQNSYEKNFRDMLNEKGLVAELICEFRYVVVMSKEHPLAGEEYITLAHLEPYIEIAHADPYVPSLSLSTVRKNEMSLSGDKHIFVFERGSQMDILAETKNSYMWVSPIPKRLLDRYGLIEKICIDPVKIYRDVLIYSSEYRFTELDNMFIEQLMKYKKEVEMSMLG